MATRLTTTSLPGRTNGKLRALRFRTGKVQVVASRVANVEECIGALEDGVTISGVTAGQFSMIDIVEHVARELGGADVDVSTWTTGVYDVERTRQLVQSGAVRTPRFLVDAATFRKSPEYAGPMIEALGVDAFRCLSVHAKITIWRGERGAAVCRSSMNLNKNLRTEQFDLTVGGDLPGFYGDWFQALWDEAGRTTDNEAIIRAVYDRFERVRGTPRLSHLPRAADIGARIKAGTL